MSDTKIGRRDWMKLGGLGSAAALLANCAQSEKAQKNSGKVNGIVFMVADGMSHGVLTMAENFSKIVNGKGTRWWQLIDDSTAVRGLMETSSASSFVTDSAAASSAWGGGMKVNNRSINVRPDGSESEPILRFLKKRGRRTGLVTTATITHATPAGFGAVSKKRDDEHLIAPQYAGVVDILLGGGRRFFDPKKRIDSRDALSVFVDSGYEFIENRETLLKSKSRKVLGLFSDGHIPFEVDRLNDEALQKKIPTLAEMSEFALGDFLVGNEKFLLQIEGGRVDHGAHSNDAAGLLWDQLAFDKALAKVLEMIDGRDDILVVVTSDHGNANPGLNGTGKNYANSDEAFKSITRMTSSYERMLGEWNNAKKVSPEFLTDLVERKLAFKLKPEETAALFASLTEKPFTEWSNQHHSAHGLLGQFAGNHTGVGWTGTSHTSDPTMISAIGPQAERFSGIVPNNEVYRHFVELLG